MKILIEGCKKTFAIIDADYIASIVLESGVTRIEYRTPHNNEQCYLRTPIPVEWCWWFLQGEWKIWTFSKDMESKVHDSLKDFNGVEYPEKIDGSWLDEYREDTDRLVRLYMKSHDIKTLSEFRKL